MNEQSNILNDLFSEARIAKPVVSFEETAAQIQGVMLSQPPASFDTSTTLSNLWAKSGVLKVVVAGIAATCVGLTFWSLLATNSSEGDREVRVVSDLTTFADTSSGGVEEPEVGELEVEESGAEESREERLENGGRESVGEKREGENRERDEHGLYAKPAPFVRGVQMLTLSDEELGRLGIVRDTAGVWSFHQEKEEGKVFGIQVSMYGTELIPSTAQRSMPTPSVVPEFRPVVITDDLGNSRVEVYEDGEESPNYTEVVTSFTCWQVLDPSIQSKILLYFRSVTGQDISSADTVLIIARKDKSNSTESLYRINIASKPGVELVGERNISRNLGESLSQQILKKDYAYREISAEAYTRSLRMTTGNLIPILVQTGREFTEADKAARHWRPDCIFWFKPTPEFLRALPEKARVRIERQLQFADLLERKPEEESIETFLDREAPELRSRLDSLNRGEVNREDEKSVAGEIYLDSWRSASGGITNSGVTPTPSRRGEEIFLRYHLAEPRSISLSLYTINGAYVKTFLEGSRRDGGEHLEVVRLDDLSVGVYLLVVGTEKGERVVQRLIVQ